MCYNINVVFVLVLVLALVLVLVALLVEPDLRPDHGALLDLVTRQHRALAIDRRRRRLVLADDGGSLLE